MVCSLQTHINFLTSLTKMRLINWNELLETGDSIKDVCQDTVPLKPCDLACLFTAEALPAHSPLTVMCSRSDLIH